MNLREFRILSRNPWSSLAPPRQPLRKESRLNYRTSRQVAVSQAKGFRRPKVRQMNLPVSFRRSIRSASWIAVILLSLTWIPVSFGQSELPPASPSPSPAPISAQKPSNEASDDVRVTTDLISFNVTVTDVYGR